MMEDASDEESTADETLTRDSRTVDDADRACPPELPVEKTGAVGEATGGVRKHEIDQLEGVGPNKQRRLLLEPPSLYDSARFDRISDQRWQGQRLMSGDAGVQHIAPESAGVSLPRASNLQRQDFIGDRSRTTLESFRQRQESILRQEEWIKALRMEADRRAAESALANRMGLERRYREAGLEELLRSGQYQLQRGHGSLSAQPIDQNSLRLPPTHRQAYNALMTTGTSVLPMLSDARVDHGKPSLSPFAGDRAPINPSSTLQLPKDDKPIANRLPRGEGMSLLLPNDKALLSDYQILIRESLEFFEVQQSDLLSSVPGRKKNVELGQVGIRCKYCAHRPPHWRGRGAVYFPGNLASVYQAAQNMATNHLLKSCEEIPQDVKDRFAAARQKQKEETRRSGGKTYWTETSRHVGLEEREGRGGIWFKSKGIERPF